MSLRDRLGLDDNAVSPNRRRLLYERYGVLENPFPPATQPMGHAHLPTVADLLIEGRLKTFLNEKNTQAVVVEGTQGTGKTNLLEYYKRELTDIFSDSRGFYIVRYYADPEPDFGAVVRRIMQEFGTDFLKRVAEKLASHEAAHRRELLTRIHNPELRRAFHRLANALPSEKELAAEYLLEYLMGLRVFKRHTEALGLHFRLDTTEAKTMALHDIVVLSRELECFEALFLFLDELEKQGSQPLPIIVRYLSTIRALIDALPRSMFLLLAMTPDARRRYMEMFPALASRLDQPVTLKPVENMDQALGLYHFYLDEGRKAAQSDNESVPWTQGHRDPLDRDQLLEVYSDLSRLSDRVGVRGGITQRQLLNRFHMLTESTITF